MRLKVYSLQGTTVSIQTAVKILSPEPALTGFSTDNVNNFLCQFLALLKGVPMFGLLLNYFQIGLEGFS